MRNDQAGHEPRYEQYSALQQALNPSTCRYRENRSARALPSHQEKMREVRLCRVDYKRLKIPFLGKPGLSLFSRDSSRLVKTIASKRQAQAFCFLRLHKMRAAPPITLLLAPLIVTAENYVVSGVRNRRDFGRTQAKLSPDLRAWPVAS